MLHTGNKWVQKTSKQTSHNQISTAEQSFHNWVKRTLLPCLKEIGRSRQVLGHWRFSRCQKRYRWTHKPTSLHHISENHEKEQSCSSKSEPGINSRQHRHLRHYLAHQEAYWRIQTATIIWSDRVHAEIKVYKLKAIQDIKKSTPNLQNLWNLNHWKLERFKYHQQEAKNLMIRTRRWLRLPMLMIICRIVILVLKLDIQMPILITSEFLMNILLEWPTTAASTKSKLHQLLHKEWA